MENKINNKKIEKIDTRKEKNNIREEKNKTPDRMANNRLSDKGKKENENIDIIKKKGQKTGSPGAIDREIASSELKLRIDRKSRDKSENNLHLKEGFDANNLSGNTRSKDTKPISIREQGAKKPRDRDVADHKTNCLDLGENFDKKHNRTRRPTRAEELKIEELIEMYRPLILASISRYCNLIGFYEDLYQDGVVEIMEAMKEFDPTLGSVGGFLKQRLKLFYINKYKRLIRRETEELDYSNEPSVLAIEDHENKMLVARLLSELPPDERVVIELSFLFEMRGQEVAKILGISRRKVYHLKDKAMRRLRKISRAYEV